jgi:hypothetical protein
MQSGSSDSPWRSGAKGPNPKVPATCSRARLRDGGKLAQAGLPAGGDSHG